MKPLRRTAVYFGIAIVIFVGAFIILRGRHARAEKTFVTAADLQTITLTLNGLTRRALVHVPSSHDGKSLLPLVFMFHGNGGTPEGVVKEMGWVAKSDAEKFIIVFPEGTRPDMTQPPKFGRNNPAWNDGSGRFHAMAFRVGLELSAQIAAIAPVSGALWMAELKAAEPVSLLYITGTADPINPMEGGAPKMASGSGFKGVPEKAKPPVREMVAKWAKLLDCAPDAIPIASAIEGITTVNYSGGREGSEVIFTTIAGHGHIWPGAKSPLPEFILGKTMSHISATDAIWGFFQRHPKQNAPP
jgi:polyhydroxybutyrate depolymerase